MSIRVPQLLAGLVDDAAMLPSAGLTPRRALAAHQAHRAAWFADLVGPLLLPITKAADLLPITKAADPLPIAEPAGRSKTADPEPAVGPRLGVGLIADAGPAPGGLPALRAALATVQDCFEVRQIEVPVAMRNHDPAPGLRALLALETGLRNRAHCPVYAEIPLTWGLLAALDQLAEARAGGAEIAPKFRTGGLAAELFPTPVELGAVICACRDRQLPFVLTAGPHRAIRRTDPETGLVTHGFLNVLGAVLAAADGAEPVDLAEILGGTDPQPVVDLIRPRLGAPRPLLGGFGGTRVIDHVSDLLALNLLAEPPSASPR